MIVTLLTNLAGEPVALPQGPLVDQKSLKVEKFVCLKRYVMQYC
jgi:hypothetical protein